MLKLSVFYVPSKLIHTWALLALILLSMAVNAPLHNILLWLKKVRFGAYFAFTAFKFSTKPA